ncbi:MAG: hypothetical protein H7138_22435, partial [Myxococcales bacterium]|nr:hypothetical protein [Myxococcales bacterium]
MPQVWARPSSGRGSAASAVRDAGEIPFRPSRSYRLISSGAALTRADRGAITSARTVRLTTVGAVMLISLNARHGREDDSARSRVLRIMASHQRQAGQTPPPRVIEDPLGYWWLVCRGPEILQAFHATPEHDAWQTVERHPALLLPELVDAAEQALGRSRAIEGLREMHHSLRGSRAYGPYQRLLAASLAR